MKCLKLFSSLAVLAFATGASAVEPISILPTGAAAFITEPDVGQASTPNTPTGSVDLGKVGGQLTPEPVKDEAWDALDDSHRFLLIMGTADGFASAGAGSPCFPGMDNAALDEQLRHNADLKSPSDLPQALKALSGNPDQCAQPGQRGYTVQLLKSMSNEHLSAYLSGVVRGYAHLRKCPEETHQYAAATVIAAVFAASETAQPVDVIAPAIEEGCRGVPSE